MEYLDVVDDADNVVGKTSYPDMYEKLLQHRIAHVMIFNSKGEMALQLRSKTKSYAPEHWSTAVGGHVQAGETYEEAAMREMKEEIGIELDLKFLAKDIFIKPNGHRKNLMTFTAIFDGSFIVNPDEVERMEYFPLEMIQDMIDIGAKFHPELLFLLKKYYKIKTCD